MRLLVVAALVARTSGYAGVCQSLFHAHWRPLHSSTSFSRVCSLSAAEGKVQCWGAVQDEANLPSYTLNSQAEVSVGGDPRTCTLGTDGRVRCWGSDPWGVISGTPGGSGFVATAAAVASQYAIRDADGGITAWGYSGSECRLCAPGFGQIAVSGGDFHACSISTYGTVTCWGWAGHWGNGNTIPGPAQYGQVMVSAGNHVTCSLSALGVVRPTRPTSGAETSTAAPSVASQAG